MPATSYRLPAKLVYHEACRSQVEAFKRELSSRPDVADATLKRGLECEGRHTAPATLRVAQARRSCAPALLAGMRAGVGTLYRARVVPLPVGTRYGASLSQAA